MFFLEFESRMSDKVNNVKNSDFSDVEEENGSTIVEDKTEDTNINGESSLSWKDLVSKHVFLNITYIKSNLSYIFVRPT